MALEGEIWIQFLLVNGRVVRILISYGIVFYPMAKELLDEAEAIGIVRRDY
jgi:hypothetical protein